MKAIACSIIAGSSLISMGWNPDSFFCNIWLAFWMAITVIELLAPQKRKSKKCP